MNFEMEKTIVVLGSASGAVTLPIPVLRPCKIKSAKVISEATITEITVEIRTGTSTVMSAAVSTGSTPVAMSRDATYGETKFDPDSATAALKYMNLYIPQQSAAARIVFAIEFTYACEPDLP